MKNPMTEETIRDRLFVAERQYQRMIERFQEGIFDKDEMISSMTAIQTAHYIALKHNPRYFLQ